MGSTVERRLTSSVHGGPTMHGTPCDVDVVYVIIIITNSFLNLCTLFAASITSIALQQNTRHYPSSASRQTPAYTAKPQAHATASWVKKWAGKKLKFSDGELHISDILTDIAAEFRQKILLMLKIPPI